MAAIIRFDNAGVSLGGRRILDDLDLIVDPGEAVGVVGPNGSGKTTLVRTAATLLPVDRGEVSILGRDPTRADLTEIRRSIGLIGHHPALIPELTLMENLQHVSRLAGVQSDRVMKALDVVGLEEAADVPVGASSFGMRRRVEIAHLLLTRPQLLLLDEAASGLDDSARDLIAALVDSVCRRGGGCVVVSHDQVHLGALCSRILRLSGGRLETE